MSVVHSSSCDKSTDYMISCLSDENISNFTVYPFNNKVNTTTTDIDSSLAYFKLLNFSIQNLRFAEPTVPKPIAIILPESKEQLVKSVLCCRKMSIEIRVRCGGHGYEGTSSVATDGASFVIIDLMNLNKVSVDIESETAWVEGGATLGETYNAIAESSNIHCFSAGSCPTVGIGGHIAGGGFGLLSRKYGLAADNVLDAILLAADGRLLDRNAMGEDVFWAIRGGGGGIWGIVYAWKIKLSPVPQTVTSFIVSRRDTKPNVAKLVHKWQFVAPNLEDSFYMSAFVGANLPETKSVIGISVTFKGLYLGPRRDVVSILARDFPQLAIVEEDCKEMSWIESVVFFSGLAEDSSTVDHLKDRYLHDKVYFKCKSDFVRAPISMNGIMAALDILEEEPKGFVIIDPYGGVMSEISCEAIPFPHRNGNIYSIQYLVAWGEEDNSNSRVYLDWIIRFYDSMTPYVSKGPRAAYINYMDLDLGVMESPYHDDAVEMARVWGEKYFLNNYDRLVRAKTLIDPDNVFRHQQGIPPLSSSIVRVRTEV